MYFSFFIFKSYEAYAAPTNEKTDASPQTRKSSRSQLPGRHSFWDAGNCRKQKLRAPKDAREQSGRKVFLTRYIQ